MEDEPRTSDVVGEADRALSGRPHDTELSPFTVTNAGHAVQRLSRRSQRSVPAAGGGDAQTAAGADIRGCRANWFTVVVDRADRLPLPVQLAPGRPTAARSSSPCATAARTRTPARAPRRPISVTAGDRLAHASVSAGPVKLTEPAVPLAPAPPPALAAAARGRASR